MENKENNSSTPAVNRAAYITILCLLAVLAVLVVMTSAANRARGEEAITVPPATTGMPGTTPPLTTTAPGYGTTAPVAETTAPETAAPETAAPETAAPASTAPETTAKPSKPTDAEPTAPVGESVPGLLLPVSGTLLAAHDLDVPVWSNTMEDYRTHCGLDIAAEPGASVCAAADGTVAQVWVDPMMGQCISVKHAGDCLTVYRNLSTVLPVGIEAGVDVRAGQLIANVGESAMVEIAEEPHVHFEVMIGDSYVNPIDYLSAGAVASLSVDTAYEG